MAWFEAQQPLHAIAIFFQCDASSLAVYKSAMRSISTHYSEAASNNGSVSPMNLIPNNSLAIIEIFLALYVKGQIAILTPHHAAGGTRALDAEATRERILFPT